MPTSFYEGYFENGTFYNAEREAIQIPEQCKVRITLLDEPEIKAITAPGKQPFSSLFGKWNGKVWMADDFDAPLDDMGEYME